MTARRQVDERREAACPIIRAPDWTARISPACAGNTSGVMRCAHLAADQPRVRGEHPTASAGLWHRPGSAPRARGTHRRQYLTLNNTRISPACAGNTAGRRSSWARCSDQPRVRGEHAGVGGRDSGVHGSAPRARGTHEDGRHADRGGRISPACAGNTAELTAVTSTISPACAGNTVDGYLVRYPGGSAPRARGTPIGGLGVVLFWRISPACAGNTGSRRGLNQPRVRGEHAMRTDQPRVRGEHGSNPMQRQLANGSAPRARGTRADLLDYRRAERISPACAGNTI